ncbi:MAG: hypothetical protein RL477_474 [Pseudomonadota bacterium]
MADEPSRRKLLPEASGAQDEDFAAVERGEARVGEVLANMRAARGLEIADIAAHLRIRDIYLAAIESGDVSRLPGPTYAIGFVRSYANFLGLNGEQAVRLFKGEREGEADKAALNFPEPVAESRIPRGALLFISMILVVAAYGGWYYVSSRDEKIADLVPQVPQAMKPATPEAPPGAAKAPAADQPAASGATTSDPAPTPATTTAGEPAAQTSAAPAAQSSAAPAAQTSAAPAAQTSAVPAVTAEKKVEPVAPAPAVPPAAVPAAAPVAQSAPAASAPAAQTAAPSVPGPAPQAARPAEPAAPVVSAPSTPAGSASAGNQSSAASAGNQSSAASAANQSSAASAAIEIRAKGDSWVQIRGQGGRVVVMRIFRTGDTFKVPDEKGLTLMTGNAGAIEILVDGKPVPAIGPFGAVRRDVALDPAKLRAGAAAR